MLFQRTVRKPIEIRGIGLHSGREAVVKILPAPEDIGLCVLRADLPGKPFVRVVASRVKATQLATTLGDSYGDLGESFHVSTVEHCLSALYGMGVDNAYISVEGDEIPILDGSSLVFAERILEVGTSSQRRERRYAVVHRPIHVGDESKFAFVQPYPGLRVTCTIDFPHPAIGVQKLDVEVNETSYLREIAPARTFGFQDQLTKLQSAGLAMGGSLSNAVGLATDGTVLNPEGLRFPDEFVRHKILDAIGDLTTFGRPLMGHLVLYKSGHDLLNQLVSQIHSEPGSFRRLSAH